MKPPGDLNKKTSTLLALGGVQEAKLLAEQHRIEYNANSSHRNWSSNGGYVTILLT